MKQLGLGISVLLFSTSALAIAPAPVAGGLGIATLAAGTLLATIAGVRYITSQNEDE